MVWKLEKVNADGSAEIESGGKKHLVTHQTVKDLHDDGLIDDSGHAIVESAEPIAKQPPAISKDGISDISRTEAPQIATAPLANMVDQAQFNAPEPVRAAPVAAVPLARPAPRQRPVVIAPPPVEDLPAEAGAPGPQEAAGPAAVVPPGTEAIQEGNQFFRGVMNAPSGGGTTAERQRSRAVTTTNLGMEDPEAQAAQQEAHAQAGQAEANVLGQAAQANEDVSQEQLMEAKRQLGQVEADRAHIAAVRQDFDRRLQAHDELVRAVASNKVDPDRAYGSGAGGGVSRLFAAIAQGLGAYGAAMTHTPNFAMEIINGEIDRDIAAQKADLDSGRRNVDDNANLLGLALRNNEDEAAATASVRAARLVQTQQYLQGLLAHAQTPVMQARVAALLAATGAASEDATVAYQRRAAGDAQQTVNFRTSTLGGGPTMAQRMAAAGHLQTGGAAVNTGSAAAQNAGNSTIHAQIAASSARGQAQPPGGTHFTDTSPDVADRRMAMTNPQRNDEGEIIQAADVLTDFANRGERLASIAQQHPLWLTTPLANLSPAARAFRQEASLLHTDMTRTRGFLQHTGVFNEWENEAFGGETPSADNFTDALTEVGPARFQALRGYAVRAANARLRHNPGAPQYGPPGASENATAIRNLQRK